MLCKTILIVDDEQLIRWSLNQELTKAGFNILEAATINLARTIVQESEPDIMILDQMLPDGTGIDFLSEIQSFDNIMPVIMLTAVDRSQTAVQALKLGAFDYVTKPINIEEIKIVIEKACESTRLKRQVASFMKGQAKSCGFFGLLGSSQVMKKVCEQIGKIALSSGTTVLITGESGTGKELAARAVHFLSERRDKQFLPINFSTLTETLVESELFGHEKGAFTDARQQKKGMFELSDGGTILLDEIGDISPKIQVKLLRILEQKAFQRVGGTQDINVDVRIIAATNQPLEKLVSEEKFRSDLYYRLNVATIHMPPLRERGNDIIQLAEYFLHEFNVAFHKNFKGISEETKKLFLGYEWPGNVRELRNVVERAVLMDEGDYIFSHHVELGHLHSLTPEEPSYTFEPGADGQSFDEIEKQVLVKALEKANKNQSQAAKLLKMSRDTLRYRLKKHKLL
ncbi:MAG: sigma-54 dependent transcriptional regulator [Bacteroidota bacterium]|nr:sigma-54 dependent transcriptional regulator [Bacteroidota bacterium]